MTKEEQERGLRFQEELHQLADKATGKEPTLTAASASCGAIIAYLSVLVSNGSIPLVSETVLAQLLKNNETREDMN